MTLSFAVLITSLLFGGMTLYSFSFAAFLFNALPAETAGLAWVLRWRTTPVWTA